MSARARAEVLWLAMLLGGAAAGCRSAEPFDPESRSRTIIAECGGDAACARERWRRDPRHWSLGLRAEVAGRDPRAPLRVETTREIESGDRRGSPCFVDGAGRAPVDYRTTVTTGGSDPLPFAVFRWDRFEEALAGHRRVVAAVAEARGDREALWRGIEGEASLDRACVRFGDKRDRCAA